MGVFTAWRCYHTPYLLSGLSWACEQVSQVGWWTCLLPQAWTSRSLLSTFWEWESLGFWESSSSGAKLSSHVVKGAHMLTLINEFHKLKSFLSPPPSEDSHFWPLHASFSLSVLYFVTEHRGCNDLDVPALFRQGGHTDFFWFNLLPFQKEKKIKTWGTLDLIFPAYFLCALMMLLYPFFKEMKKKNGPDVRFILFIFNLCRIQRNGSFICHFWENIFSSFCSADRFVEIGLERYFTSSSCPYSYLKADSCPVLSSSMTNSSTTVTFFFPQKYYHRK